MAISVRITGTGAFAGSEANIGEYNVSEESTPIVASDTSGAVGGFSFSAVDDPSRLGSMLLYNSAVSLTDGSRGETQGVIDDITSRDGIASVSVVSRLGSLVVDKTALLVNSNFDTAIRYYLSLGGIVDDVAVDSTLVDIPILAPGWTGDLWTKIKELCVYVGAEIALVKGDVVIRPVRGRRALEVNNVNTSWKVTRASLAREVEVFYYDSEYISDGLVYPYGGWTPDVPIYSVDAGETLTVNIPIDVSLSDLEAPVVQDSVTRTYEASSVYCVAGNDGFAIPAAMWTDYGGTLTATIGEDGQSIDLTVYGPTGIISRYAPYRIAMSSGPGDYYSSLRLVGTGVGYNKQSIIVPTGADPEQISRDVGVSVDFPFVRDVNEAYDLALDLTAKWASPERTIQLEKTDVRQPGETDNNFDFATFADFDATYAGQTFGEFDMDWIGATFADFDAYWYSLVQDDFDFQVFGNAGGARIQYRRAMYRIRTASIGQSNVSITAESDTTFEDFDGAAEDMTFEDFDELYAGLTFEDFSLIPMAQVGAEYDRY